MNISDNEQKRREREEQVLHEIRTRIKAGAKFSTLDGRELATEHEVLAMLKAGTPVAGKLDFKKLSPERTIESAYCGYRVVCYPGGMHPDMELQLKQAFYTGALCYSRLLSEITSQDDKADEQCAQEVMELRAEVEKWCEARSVSAKMGRN